MALFKTFKLKYVTFRLDKHLGLLIPTNDTNILYLALARFPLTVY